MTDNIVIWALLLAVAGRVGGMHHHDKEPYQGRHLAGRGLGSAHRVMFLMGATLAAVLELSVCAGLITAVFVSTISMTKNITDEEQTLKQQDVAEESHLPALHTRGCGHRRVADVPEPAAYAAEPQRCGMTSPERRCGTPAQLDIFGQILIVLAGVFGVVVLFKGKAVKK